MHSPIYSFTHTLYSTSIYFRLFLCWAPRSALGRQQWKRDSPWLQSATPAGQLRHSVCSRAWATRNPGLGSQQRALGRSHPGKEERGYRQEGIAFGSPGRRFKHPKVQMPWHTVRVEEPKGRPVGAEGPWEPQREVWIAPSGNGKRGEPGSGEGCRGVLWRDLWEWNGWVIPAWVNLWVTMFCATLRSH